MGEGVKAGAVASQFHSDQPSTLQNQDSDKKPREFAAELNFRKRQLRGALYIRAY